MELAPKKVAVVGGGLMGTGIAALMANNDIAVDVYDISREVAAKSVAAMTNKKAKIPILYSMRRAKLVTARGLDQMEAHLGEADMIVEAVPEVLSIKTKTYDAIDAHRKAGSIVCTNTSGLSIDSMAEGRSEDFRKHFLGTHYFNPVRFMPLVEIISGSATDQGVVDALFTWIRKVGKTPLLAYDKPNFIANRVGIYAFAKALRLMEKYGFDTETVDMITGTPIGAPKTATFRLADLVGIDTLYHVLKNSYENCPDDEERDVLEPPAFLERLIEEKKLGDKTGGGFYKKGRDEKGKRIILTLDLKTWEYRPQRSPKSDCVRVAKKFVAPEDRIRSMVTYDGDDPVCNFSRDLVLSTAAYAMNRVGEAAPDAKSVDAALKLGFSRSVGPIEGLDAIGLETARGLMQDAGVKVPALLEECIASTGRFSKDVAGQYSYWDRSEKALVRDTTKDGLINLKSLRAEGKVVRENLNARLIDMGDGILCCQLDAKMVPNMNPIDDYVISMMMQIFDVVEEGFRGVVIGNQADNFCAGAQLMMILELSKRKMWKEIEQASGGLQMIATFLKHAHFPVVTAPHGMTLGGGLEVTLAGHKVVAHAETYAGLVEAGVGLIPGGAGTLMLLRQWYQALKQRNPGPMPPVVKTFELIGMAQVSKSAEDARDLGMVARDVVVVRDKAKLLTVAKDECVKLCEGGEWKMDMPFDMILPGEGGYLALASQVDGMLANGTITPHSATIGKKLAWVLTGGDKGDPVTPISEQDYLANERQAFLELCGMKLSQDRMAHMLKKGKPLLN